MIRSLCFVIVILAIFTLTLVNTDAALAEVSILNRVISDGNIVGGTGANAFRLSISSEDQDTISSIWFTCENYSAVELIIFRYLDSDSNLIELTTEFEEVDDFGRATFPLGEEPIILGNGVVEATVRLLLADISEQVPSGINVQVNLGGYTVDDEVTQHELEGPLWRLLVSEPSFWSVRVIERLENGPVEIFSTSLTMRGDNWVQYQVPLIITLNDDVVTDELFTLSNFFLVFDEERLVPGEDFEIITDDGRVVLSDDGFIEYNDEAQLCFIWFIEPLVFGHNGQSCLDIWAEAGNVVTGGGIDSITVFIPDLDEEPLSGTLDDLESAFFIGFDGHTFHNGWKFRNIGESEAEIVTSEGERINAYPYAQPENAYIIAGTNGNNAFNARIHAGGSDFWLNQFSVELTEGLDNRSVESLSILYENEAGQTLTFPGEIEDNLFNFDFFNEQAFVSANSDAILRFSVAISEIGPNENQAKSGDLLQFKFSSEGFVAHDAGGHEYRTFGGEEIVGPYLCVRGNAPIITVLQGDELNNGPVDLVKFQINADEGTDLAITKVPVQLALMDVDYQQDQPLALSEFQVLTGPLFDDLTHLEEDTDYIVWTEDGRRLSQDDQLVCNPENLRVKFFVQFYNEQIIRPGAPCCLVVHALCTNFTENMNGVDYYSSDLMVYEASEAGTYRLDMGNEDNPLFGLIDSDGHYIDAPGWIWSDFTGDFGDANHRQTGDDGSSRDYINGLRFIPPEPPENEVKFNRPFEGEPTGFLLQPAYPNPFNSITRLAYGLPEASNVSIQVFDINGRQIVDLFKGNQSVGQHSIVWDANGFSAGVYLIRLEANGQTLNQKVILVK